jgi:hypothetical protein
MVSITMNIQGIKEEYNKLLKEITEKKRTHQTN